MVLRWVGLAIFVLLLLIGVAAYRGCQALNSPIGHGQSKESPNGQFIAHAMNMQEDDFWGNTRSYYVLTVETDNGTEVRSTKIPAQSSPVNFYTNTQLIFWSSDSKAVSFGAPQNTVWSTPVP